MKTLSPKAYGEIRAWMHRNAREVDLATWQVHFEGGSHQAVLSALSFYQNEDGGFGHALEADSWNPASSPSTTYTVILRLRELGFADAHHPIVQGMLRYFESGDGSNENGWLFSIPSNNGYPRAPWWTYDPEANRHEHTGVTAGIVCFALEYAPKASPLYKRAAGLAQSLLARFDRTENLGDMGLGGCIFLVETIKRLGLTEQFDITGLAGALRERVDAAIVRDVAQWAHYGVRPSQFIASPDSPFYPGNEEIIEKELDYLIDTRPEGGVWGITWHWHNLQERYAKEFAVSENWWRAGGAIGNVRLLKAFGRLPEGE